MTSKETIYRQDVLDLAKKGVLISNGNYESVCKAINEIPSVNPIEPCKDAIDRAEAIKVASGYCHPANVAKELAKLPPVTPQPKTGHWIPVSERLPEKYTYTLWCASSRYVRSDYFNGEFWEDAKKLGYEVIAWMPLPKPYEPQESEE